MYFMYTYHICLVFVPYALTLPVSGLSFMSIKICSVLFWPINFSAFIFASTKFILFWCFYCYNHADFDRKLINQAFR